MLLGTYKVLTRYFNSSNLKGKTQSNISSDLTNFHRGKTIKGCPLVLTMRALRPFIEVLNIAEKSFVLYFVKEVKAALMDRLDNLTENEIKELDKDILREVIEVLKSYISITDPENQYKIAEQYELIIAEKYLRCPFFEKRVRGINELKDIFYKVINSQSRSKAQLDQ